MDTGVSVTETSDIAIYLLRDPRTHEVRYVGQTQDPVHRLRQHLNTFNRTKSSPKNVWLNDLVAEGLEPVVEVISMVTRELADEAERFHIFMMREMSEPLTNVTDGGAGRRGDSSSDETREKMRASVMAFWETGDRAAHGAIVSAARTGLKISDEGRQKISERMKGKLPDCLATTAAVERRLTQMPRGATHYNARVNEDEVREIRRLAASGVSHTEIGRQMGVSNGLVGDVVHRRTWRHVDP